MIGRMTRSLALAAGLLVALTLACGAAVNTVDWGRLSASNIVAGELLVGFKDGKVSSNMRPLALAARVNAHAAVGATVIRAFATIPFEHVRIPAGMSLANAARLYAADSNVAYVEPNYILHASVTPNDPSFSAQWGMTRIGAPAAWDLSTGSTNNVVVAVIDTGVRRTHEDLAANAWKNSGEDWKPDGTPGNNGIDDDGDGYVDDYWGWDFVANDNNPNDENGHGTHCAGVIGAVGNNGKGVAGVNWRTQVMGLRFLDAGGSGSTVNAILCIEYASQHLSAARRPKVLSNSWGGTGSDAALKAAIDYAGNQGQLFVAAAGNDGVDNDTSPHYPSSYTSANLVSVASIDSSGALSSFSNYGKISVDLAAPGRDIYSTFANSDSSYISESGTSMATPHVAGAAALLWAFNPALTMAEVKAVLFSTVRANTALTGKMVTGGELDVAAAMKRMTLLVTPQGGQSFRGPPGGPFTPSNVTYTVANPTPGAINWRLTCDKLWLDLSSTSGVLSAGASNLVVVAPNSVATNLPMGFYDSLLTFSDNTHSTVVTRAVYLQVGNNYSLCSTPYLWTDPASATALSFTGGVSAAIDMPFQFSFYGQTYSNFHVSSHGLIGFGDPYNLGSTNYMSLGVTNPPYAILAPLWSTVDATLSLGNVTWGVAGNTPARQLIVRWTNARSIAEPTATNTFQVVIPETTTPVDNDIIFQYLDAAQDAPLTGGGRMATIGIQDQSGQGATEYSSSGSSLLADGMGMCFTMQRPPDTNAPAPTVRFLTESGSNLTFEVRFNEIVTAGVLTPASFVVGGTLSNLTTVTAVSGNGVYGLRYLVTASVGVGGDYGSVSLSLRGGVIADLYGNLNTASAPCFFVRPFRDLVFRDDMELGPFNWTASGSNNFSQIISDVWRWGVPSNGPPAACSPTHCWGTGMTGKCPDNAWATLQTPSLPVGENPVLKYAVWHNFNNGYGFAEVYNGSSWINVTPNSNGFYWAASVGWKAETVTLDPAQFGNRDLRVRFRVLTGSGSAPQAGMFVDDVSLSGRQPPGVWVTAFAPSTNVAPSTNWVGFTAYNSSTATLSGVSAAVSSSDAGVTATGRVSYGLMNPGAIVTGGAPVKVTLAAPEYFRVPVVSLFHSATSTVGAVGQQYLAFYVTNVTAAAGSNTLWVKMASGASVSDWMGRYLAGDGSADSCLFQVIAAGTNGVSEPPGPGGQVSGDDQLLYELGGTRDYGRFGVGAVPPDMGQFVKAFSHSLPSGSKVYVRAWDAPSADAAVVYGDSASITNVSATLQTNKYTAWSATNILNYLRDSNGDGVPDGWCIQVGLDPRAAASALPATWSQSATANTDLYTYRVAARSNWVYVAEGSGGSTIGKIDIWSRDLATHIGTFPTNGSASGLFHDPHGLAISSNRLAVADTLSNRVVVLSLNPTNGALALAFAFGNEDATTRTNAGQLWKPQGVGLDQAGNFYVADTKNNRVQVFNPTGALVRVFTNSPLQAPAGICVDSTGRVYVANTDGNNVLILDGAGLTLATLGGFGTNNGYFSKPTDVQIGFGGRIYVMDQNNARVQMFGTNGTWIATYKSPLSLSFPNGLWPSPDDGSLYVADTRHQQVLRMWPVSDQDGDGMDDIWEDLHGLNSNDPSDAFLDADLDGVTNLGEYRIGTDPQNWDTNGNGASDLWDMQNGHSPLGPAPLGNTPPHLVALTCDVTGRPVVYGETVHLTAIFNKAMTDTPMPNLGLNGGATLSPTPMTKTVTNVFVFDYALQAADAGAVNAIITGAQDTTGLSSDPMTIVANGIFAATQEVIRISTVAQAPYVVNWSAISSFVYQVQTAPLLPTTNWDYVSTWTSAFNGVMAVPVAGQGTNREIFYRVQREKPPW